MMCFLNARKESCLAPEGSDLEGSILPRKHPHTFLLVYQSSSPVRSGPNQLRRCPPTTNTCNPREYVHSWFGKMDSAEPEISFDNIVLKKSSTLVVWEYFRFEMKNVQEKKVLCKSCCGTVTTSQGNTTNLYQHLKEHHRYI